MAAPVWITPPGDLGTIVEGEFYQVQLGASNASTYAFHSGRLPDGIVIRSNGTVEGYPSNKDYIQGVPSEVAVDTFNQFGVRVTSTDGQVADRVFSLTVTGPDDPVIDTLPAADLGAFFDGDVINLQLTATDEDPGTVFEWSIRGGELPPGLLLSTSGLISGYITPEPADDGTAGFDNTNFDTSAFDFTTRSVTKSYEFTAQVSDGTRVDQKTYTLLAVSRNMMTADTTEFTADAASNTASASSVNILLTADQTPQRDPILTTPAQNIGIYAHDNFFTFKFDGIDLDSDPIVYELTSDLGSGFDADAVGFDTTDFGGAGYNAPPGIELDTDTGWFYGTLPSLGAVTAEYDWAVRVKKKNNTDRVSDWVFFTMTVEGDIDKTITWPAADLGTIKTGSISELDIRATIGSGASVQYELKSNYAQNLPQGLKLDSTGLVLGRVSFETLMFDTGDTTFDVQNKFYAETTWERQHTFTVRAFSNDLTIDTFKTFTITIVPSSIQPYESLYVRALPNQTQRGIYDSLINNADDIDPADIYRSSDYYFGIQRDIKMLIAAGLNPKEETDYVEATAQNHWNNILRFGGFKTARALNADGSVRYEIVYMELVDKAQGINPATNLPAPASQRIDLRSSNNWINPLSVDAGEDYFITVDSGNYRSSANNDYIAYPNAIQNMRNRLKSAIGEVILERTVLPQWMQSKQEDNSVPGWTLAAPLVYCKPGTSKKIKYLLEQRTSIDLKQVSFEIDRYILDNNLSKYYNKDTSSYTVTAETTFDINLSITSESIAAPTTLDGNGTRFFADVDVYTNLDVDDTYIKFPQVGVFK